MAKGTFFFAFSAAAAVCLAVVSCKRGTSPAAAPATQPTQPQPSASQAPGRLDNVRRLIAAGQYDRALADVDAVIAALPPTARLTAWRIDYSGQLVREALIGERHAYVVTERSRYADGTRRGIELDDKRPVIRHDKQGYDAGDCVTCVDLKTGKRLWTRYFSGAFRYTVGRGPGAGDDLWAQASKVFRLDAASGEVRLQRDVGPQWRAVHGIGFGGQVFLHEHDNSMTRVPRPNVFDAESGQINRLAFRPSQYSPNRLRVVRRGFGQSPSDVTSTVSVWPAVANADEGGGGGSVGGEPVWKYDTPGYSANDPVWLGDDVLVLSGMQDTRGAVARLDGASGAVKWTYVLPCGAYSLDHVYLADNSHLSHRWDAVGVLAGHVAAIDGHGELVLLDPETGRRRASTTRAPAHLAMPKQAGANVVLAGTDAMTAIPTDVLLERVVDGEREALLLKATALLGRNKAREAMAVAKSLTEQAPNFADGWRVRGKAAQALGDAGDAVISGVRAMAAAGESRSAELQRSHGLLARIATGPVSAALAPVGPFVFAGSQDGTLSKIDAASLEVIDVARFPADVTALRLRDDTLYRWGTNRHEEQVATFAGLPPPPSNAMADPLFASREMAAPKDAPREWHTMTGYDGPVVRYRDRWYRPLGGGGGVRVLDGATVSTYPAGVTPPIESWSIYLGGGGGDEDKPIGFGGGGVYELDEHLAPVRKLIDTGSDRLNRRPHQVALLAINGQTLALVQRRSEQSVIQIWTRDGKQKLREETAALAGGGREEAGRLLPLKDGYFFSGAELLWLNADRTHPVWRFALQAVPPPPMRHHSLRNYDFGVPRVVGDHVFVACREGGVFVFSAEALTSVRP